MARNKTLWLGLLLVVVTGVSGLAQTGTRLITSTVRLHQQPSIGSPVLESVPKGGAVNLQGCSAGWCKVSYRDVKGYLPQRYLASPPPDQPSSSSAGKGYTNVDGQHVASPVFSDNGPPPGASARCRDGSYSFSTHRRGTCSHHGGVGEWLP